MAVLNTNGAPEVEEIPYVEHAHVGVSGSHVAAYERILALWAGEGPSETTTFTQETAVRVRAFQRAWSLARPDEGVKATGAIGPATHAALVRSADSKAGELLREEYSRRHPVVTARELVVRAALLALTERGIMVYSGRDRETVRRRWQGIDEHIVPPDTPLYADCSSLATWCLWVARDHGATDPSDRDWAAGYTGSMEANGIAVEVEDAKPGSLFFYSNEDWGGHVGIMVERVRGTPFIVSFGFEGGPSYLRYDYRTRFLGWNDLTTIRDYIVDPAATGSKRARQPGADRAASARPRS